ncbi:MAG: DUF4384 domain-containing protein [Verrucomicrobiae bacterium]|nr:DUF4384 domain-containing protein [Verrucomicrobiae bacterium]
MTIEEALDIIGSKPDDSLEKVELRYCNEKKVWTSKLASSLLPRHVEGCQKRLRELDEAMDVVRKARQSVVIQTSEVSYPNITTSGPKGVGDWIQRESAEHSGKGIPSQGSNSQEITRAGGKSLLGKLVSFGGRIPDEYRWMVPSGVISSVLVVGLVGYFLKTNPHKKEPGGTHQNIVAVPEVEKKESFDFDKVLGRVDQMIAAGEPLVAVREFNALSEKMPDGEKLKSHRERLVTILSADASDNVRLGENIVATQFYKAMVELDPLHPLSGVALEQLNKLSVPQGRIRVSAGEIRTTITLFKIDAKGDAKTVLEKEAPADFVDLLYGTYAVLAEAEGFSPGEIGPFVISSGQLLEIPVNLERSLGGLKVTANLERAKFKVVLVEGPASLSEKETVEEDGFAPGELKKLPTGKYEVTFPEQDLSREVVVEAGTVKELAVLLGPGSQQETVTSNSGSSGSRAASGKLDGVVEALEVKTDRASYRDGEAVRVSVRIPRDGFLRVYSVDAEQAVYQVFPSEFEPENRVRAGEMRSIPGVDTYRLRLTLPGSQASGQEKVFAVFSDSQFTDSQLRDFEQGSFPSHGQVGQGFSVSKGLSPEAIASAVAGVATYEVSR